MEVDYTFQTFVFGSFDKRCGWVDGRRGPAPLILFAEEEIRLESINEPVTGQLTSWQI